MRGRAKVTVIPSATLVRSLRVTAQVPVPVQPPPLQPLKIEPVAGAAVNVTAVPLAYGAEQVAPQVIPAGALVAVPLPVPAVLTVRWKVGTVNVAVTVVDALRVTVQVPVPVQPPPLQPLNRESVAEGAGEVTAVPLAYGAEQVAPQVIPAGVLVIVPRPVPVVVPVSMKVGVRM